VALSQDGHVQAAVRLEISLGENAHMIANTERNKALCIEWIERMGTT
jgi:hypothetical protein